MDRAEAMLDFLPLRRELLNSMRLHGFAQTAMIALALRAQQRNRCKHTTDIRS